MVQRVSGRIQSVTPSRGTLCQRLAGRWIHSQLVKGVRNPAGVCRYSPGRWVWWNAAAKSRVLRLEALSRSLPLGSQSCLFCVSRTHPV